VAAAFAFALTLTGCSSSGEDAAGTTTGTTAGTAAAGTKAADAKAGGAASAPISAEDLCAHLKKELPRIKAVGSEVGAMAQLTISIANLYDDHLEELDGDVLDAQATKTCPQTRTEILKAAGVDSFTDL